MRCHRSLGAIFPLVLLACAVFAPTRAHAARFRFGTPVASRASGPSPSSASSVSGWTGCGVTLTPPTTNSLYTLAIVPDGSGGVEVAWSDGRSGNLNGFVSRLDANGDHASGWNLDGNALSVSDSSEVCMGVGTDGAGGIFAVLSVVNPPLFSYFHDAYLQHRTASGGLAAGYPANGKALISGDVGTIGILPDGAGNVFFGWSSPAGSTVRAKLLDPSGDTAPGWPASGIDTGIPDDAVGEPALDGAGGLYVIWALGTEIKVQRFDAAGVANGWPAGGVVVHTSSFQLPTGLAIRIVRLSSGDALAVWEDPETAHITAQRVTSAGAVHGSWPATGLDVSNGVIQQEGPSVVADAVGGALVLWHEQVLSFPPSFRILVQRVTATGGISGGWPATGVSLSAGFTAFAPSNLVGDGNNGALAAWMDLGNGQGDILAQHVLATGTTDPAWGATGVTLCAAAGDQILPWIVSDDAGGLIATWFDYVDQLQPQVKASRVLGSGVVSALAALVDVSAEPGLVRLHWFTPDGSAARATVERAQDGGGFTALAEILADGGGHLRFEDRDVVAGASYTYQLAVMDGGTIAHLGRVTVRVPASPTFAIEGLRPNPAGADPSVAFALESAEPARLEVLDAVGRRVFAREVGSLGPGQHVLRLSPERRLPPGIYSLRLVQNGRVAVARAAIVL